MIPLYRPYIPAAAKEPLLDVLSGTAIADGPMVRAFEQGMADYLGNPNATSVGDISAAIQLSLILSECGQGSEVLASPMACVATNQPVVWAGATIRWCDVDPKTGLLDPEDAAKRINERTKAILVPLWAGDVPELYEFYRLAREHGLTVVEDAGEALGSIYRDQKIGATGADFTAFSFHAIRHITTGEGALLSMRNADLLPRLQALRRYGIFREHFRDKHGEIREEFDIEYPGLNSYMTHIAGAIGVAQLDRLEDVLYRHRENGQWFDRELADIDGISVCPRPVHRQSSYWVYTMLAERRDDLLVALRDRGVYASKVHARNDTYRCFHSNTPRVSLPGVDAFAARVLCLPCGWWVEQEEREVIRDALKKGW